MNTNEFIPIHNHDPSGKNDRTAKLCCGECGYVWWATATTGQDSREFECPKCHQKECRVIGFP